MIPYFDFVYSYISFTVLFVSRSYQTELKIKNIKM